MSAEILAGDALQRAASADDADPALRFAAALESAAPGATVGNVHATMAAIRVDGLCLPLAICDHRPGDSYVTSLHTLFYRYPTEELLAGLPAGLGRLAAIPIRLLGRVQQMLAIDRVVQVNCWLTTTNPMPRGLERGIEDATRALIRAYPDHAIVLRSIVPSRQHDLAGWLRTSGWWLLPTRRIYMLGTGDPGWRRPRKLREDRNMAARLDSHELSRVDGSDDTTLEDIAALYDSLYRQKYSALSPALGARFLSLASSLGILELRALRNRATGRIEGCAGWFRSGTDLVAPFIGLAPDAANRIQLYRVLVSAIVEQSHAERRDLNMSAGRSRFKRLRAAEPAIEVTAIHARHLRPRRRLCYAVLGITTKAFAAPFIRAADD